MPQAYRASILHFLADPGTAKNARALAETYEYFADGLLLVDRGVVQAVGNAETLLPKLDKTVPVTVYENALLTPGFIDTHIHYPQTEMIAAHGEQLLEWLQSYTYPIESKFNDHCYASGIAERFLDELLRCGTTSALVFGTVHPQSVDAFFEACEQRDLRMICGKVMMDRNAPEYLTDTAESGYSESRALIHKWHNRGRLRYAVTPRFAPTSTGEQLSRAGELLQEFPDVYLHTHLAENPQEIDWVKQLFPEAEDYLDVYERAGLLGKRSVFAHCLHLGEREWQRLGATDSRIAFCPTSNLFLGSGLFPFSRARQQGIRVGLGTDVGGGSSFSILQTLNEAYKVLQLRGETLTPLQGFYLATLGGARVLDMDDVVGSFRPGREADFVVLDKACTPLLEFRMQQCRDLNEELFVLAMLGDDRAVRATYANGRLVHRRDLSDADLEPVHPAEFEEIAVETVAEI
ncbi:guanine deaminase [Microbulbifer bruguierae]|uniref:Guanine deaminase n=1 Tax=Microbulbifer bruguierae TaxID=3029061 RepID=A0ABY8NCL9_9GAMM|nr:guanine deaminase [Microbulbifer bruguierae]WGL15168.1 guanine deaminase [Microbulbifer bruguierae]